MILNILKKIKIHIEINLAKISSRRYINFLRKKGCTIGSDVIFIKPRTIDIDFSRPLLIEIGDNVKFNKGVSLMTHDGSTIVFKKLYKDFLPSSGKIKIGNNVYIGRYTTILKNVEIGDNCIIGYGSLVTKSIPPNSVVAGHPAKVICSIDEYYKKRKILALKEAVEYAQIIYTKSGKKPTMYDLYEEFPFFLDGDMQDPGLKIPISYQTRGIEEHWKQNHKAPFKNFDEFLKYAGIE